MPQNTVNQSNQGFSLRRAIKLVSLTLGSTGMLLFLAIVIWVNWPLMKAWAWHAHNGSTLSFRGHTFVIPLRYEPEAINGGNEITMWEYPGLFTDGGSSVLLESNSKFRDQAAAQEWQSNLVRLLNQHEKSGELSVPLTIHSKSLTYLCIDTPDIVAHSMMCHAVGSDISVSTTASPGHEKVVRSVIERSN